MTAANYVTKNLDHHGLVAGFCKDIGLAKLIDDMLPEQSESKNISYGELLVAMIINGLGFTGRTLHMYPQYFEDKPLERLIRPGIEACHINDDALGRCLDKLYKHDVSTLYQSIGESVVSHLGLPCESINTDTTSIHVDGDYEVDDDFKGIRITKGYSRDHRPELNQVILNLITENQAGIPVYMKACSGNANDTETFKKFVKSHIKSLKAAQKCRYLIGDSALYVAETIKLLQEQGQFFITRVPQKLVEAKSALTNLHNTEWSELDNGYKGAWVESHYADVPQKWFIVHSQQASKRELTNLEKRIKKSFEKSEKSFKKLCRQSFSCKTDAISAMEVWQQQQDYVVIDKQSIVEEKKYPSTGRPARGVTANINYKIAGVVVCCDKRKQKAESMLGLFILSTNDLTKKLGMQAMLDHYKSQQSVEKGFRFLKSPDFLVSSLFLKKPERIEALLMVMTCCLMVYAALEHTIRTSLKESNAFFPDMKNKPSQNPTARWVFYCFQGIHELMVGDQKETTIICNLKERNTVILRCLGLLYEEIYSEK